jgi:ribose transport system ATP-binding protein
MRSGHIAGEIKRSATSPLNQENIMALATGMEPFDA